MHSLSRTLLGSLLALWIPACAAPSVVRAPADVLLQVELVPAPALHVQVEIDARGDADGETTFAIVDDWGGTKNSQALLRDVVVTANGRGLDVATSKPGAWTVHHAPNESLHMTYSIPANEIQKDPDPSGHYKAIVGAGLVHFIGYTALALPERDEDGATEHVRFEWIGFDAAGWKTACSFSAERAFERDIELSKLHEAVYLAGPDLVLHQRSIRGRDLCVAFAGKWSKPEEPFVDAAANVVDLERAFFDDDAYPYYLVSVIPIGVPSQGTSSIGGTGLTDSFALFLLDGTDIDPASSLGARLLHLLAHEMFHNWNGRVLERASPEELVYWFSEGFTDFYARRLLHRAHLMDEAAFVDSWNERFHELFASPVRAAGNERIQKDFWNDPDVQKLPYQRGDVVALLIDGEIRRRTHGARSLDDWMRELVARGRRGERISNESLIADIAALTDANFAESIRRIVVDGALPAIAHDVLAPCFDLAVVDVPAWDPGFDLEATRRDHVLRGVREGSNAWLAGARDDMKLLGWSVSGGDIHKPIECTILDGAEKRKLSWMPHGPAVATPQIQPGSGARASECSRL
jgi:predicted metalloprotease with PDZ domain